MIDDSGFIPEKVSPWVWRNFHRRGAISHYLRCRSIAKCAAGDDDHVGWTKTWMQISVIQTSALFTTTAFLAVSEEARSQTDYANNVHANNREELIPLGCVSPLGTLAAIDALYEVAEQSHNGSFFRSITFPFLLLTLREIFVWSMIVVMMFVPGSVAVWRLPAEASPEQLALAFGVFLAGQWMSFVFLKLFRSII